jgi:hypothetical protein
MKPALVIGNGRSRLNFDLYELKKYMTTYGCNALYRDFIPDILVSMDIHMVTEIINSRVHHKCKFYTQHVNDMDLLAGNGEPIHFVQTYQSTPDSGTAALELAAIEHETIYIIGFDYHNGSHNNVYSGTANYNPKNYSTPIIQDEKWRTRLYNIVKRYPNTQFYRVSDDIEQITYNNLHTIQISQFEETVC